MKREEHAHNSKWPIRSATHLSKYRPRIKEQPVTLVARIYRDESAIEGIGYNEITQEPQRNRNCSKVNDILTAIIADPLLNRNLSRLAQNTGSWSYHG